MNEDDEVMVDEIEEPVEAELEVEADVEEEPVETEAEDESDPIKDFINYIDNSDYNKAEDQFKDLIGDRLQTALDQARVRIAGEFYNEVPAEEPADVEQEQETA